MRRIIVLVAVLLTTFAGSARSQKAAPEPLHVAAGTVLTFHLQVRLHPTDENQTDKLAQGTVLRVKLLEALDSTVDRDGKEFHGVVVSPVVSGDQVIVHPDAEIRGVLALLRSKSHPEGFRYELLITSVKDQGKSYDVTASLNPSFFEEPSQPAPGVKPPTN